MDILLSAVCADLCATAVRVRAEHTRAQYRFAVADYSRWLKRPAVVGDLTDDNVASFMRWLSESRGLAPRTVNGRRDRILAIWRWAVGRGAPLVKLPNVGKLVEPKRIPRAWTIAELEKIFACAAAMPGRIFGRPAHVWWLSFLGLCWDTGERTGALLALRWEFLNFETGCLWVPAELRKGSRRDDVHRLHKDTLVVLRGLAAFGGERIFGPVRDPSRFYQLYKRLVVRAGIPASRYNGPQKMRRSFASYLAAAGGDPSAALGHSSEAITRRFYLDPTICGRESNRLLFRLLPQSVLHHKRADDLPGVAVGRQNGDFDFEFGAVSFGGLGCNGRGK